MLRWERMEEEEEDEGRRESEENGRCTEKRESGGMRG